MEYSVHKFGANPDVAGSSTTEDVSFEGSISWLTAATTVRIKAGDVADVDSTGAGARTVVVEGLDSNWEVATETLACNGDSAGSAGSVSFIRVYRAYVETAGTVGGNNTDDVVVENSSGGTDLITIGAGRGQTETTGFTVPAGKEAYLKRVSAAVAATKPCDMAMWQRQNADDVTVPVSAKRLVHSYPELDGSAQDDFIACPVFPAKTDLWWTATTGTSAAGVKAEYDLIIVDA
jgi:hypothetical protein